MITITNKTATFLKVKRDLKEGKDYLIKTINKYDGRLRLVIAKYEGVLVDSNGANFSFKIDGLSLSLTSDELVSDVYEIS